jgi:hypothetical protein
MNKPDRPYWTHEFDPGRFRLIEDLCDGWATFERIHEELDKPEPPPPITPKRYRWAEMQANRDWPKD